MLSAPTVEPTPAGHPPARRAAVRIRERPSAVPVARHRSRPSSVASASASAGSAVVQRCGDHPCDCAADTGRRDGPVMQARPSGSPLQPAPAVPSVVFEVLRRGTGQRLDRPVADEMRTAFGRRFDHVRVHTDGLAARSAAAVGADAYTVGHDIVFAAGRYRPATADGASLLAHELTHVVQQSGGGTAGHGLVLGAPADAAEHEAASVSASVLAGRRTNIHGHARPNSVQRQAAGSATRTPSASRSDPVVADGLPVAAGQMRHSEFLAKLRDTVIQGCDEELIPFGRSARGCPIILRTIERYRTRPPASIVQLIRLFAHAPQGADANGLIAAATRQARVVSRRLGEKFGERGPRLQAMTETGRDGPRPHDPLTIRSQLGSGRPLDRPAREGWEAAFGRSLASVRIHADSAAARLSAGLGAQAFTIGDDIAFATNRYRPGTVPGDTLLGHELAHTVQQGRGAAGASDVDDQALERQADNAARAAASGRDVPATLPHAGQHGIRVQRWPAVVAAGVLLVEAAPEVAVVAEIGVVSSEVVVVDSALVATTELVAPAAIEALMPVAAETLAPVALETLAPAAVASSSSALSTAAATIGVGVASTTLSSDSPTEQEEEEKKKKRRCRPDPCDHPLPISWPAEFPYPDMSPRSLVRTSSADLEWLGIDRAADQSRLAQDIRRARDAGVPPPQPCFEDDAEPNAPYDAHHIHPLYLGGEEAPYNLCALRADRHQVGHPRLNNQSEHLAEYLECGICSGFLYKHPYGQEYVITSSK